MQFNEDTPFELVLAPYHGLKKILARDDAVYGMGMIGFSPLFISIGLISMPWSVKEKMKRYRNFTLQKQEEKLREENENLTDAQRITREQEKERCKVATRDCGGYDFEKFRWFRHDLFSI